MTVTFDGRPPADKMTCQECGHTGPGNAYHPYAFCVLIKAKQDPWRVVAEAAALANQQGWPK